MISIVALILQIVILHITNQFDKTPISTPIAIILIVMFSFVYAISIYANKKNSGLTTPLIVAYLVRILLLFIDVFGKSILHLPASGGDTEVFYSNAVYYAEGTSYWKGITVETFGIMAKYIGTNRLYLQFLLMLTSVATIHVLLQIMRELEISTHGKRIAVWIIGLIPNYVMMSPLFLRESLISLIMTLSLYMFVKWWRSKNEIYLICAFAFSFLGALYHSGVIGVAMGYICVRLLYDLKADKFRLSFNSIVSAVALLLLFAYLYSNYSSILFGKMQNIETIADISTGQGRGGSSYAAIAGNSSNIGNFIVYSPWRMFLFLFTPLPFQIRGIPDIIAMVFSAWFYLWVMIRAIKYSMFSDNKYRHLVVALLIVGLAFAFVFGWGSTNYGTNARHRDKVIATYVLILAITFEDKRLSRIRIKY